MDSTSMYCFFGKECNQINQFLYVRDGMNMLFVCILKIDGVTVINDNKDVCMYHFVLSTESICPFPVICSCISHLLATFTSVHFHFGVFEKKDTYNRMNSTFPLFGEVPVGTQLPTTLINNDPLPYAKYLPLGNSELAKVSSTARYVVGTNVDPSSLNNGGSGGIPVKTQSVIYGTNDPSGKKPGSLSPGMITVLVVTVLAVVGLVILAILITLWVLNAQNNDQSTNDKHGTPDDSSTGSSETVSLSLSENGNLRQRGGLKPPSATIRPISHDEDRQVSSATDNPYANEDDTTMFQNVKDVYKSFQNTPVRSSSSDITSGSGNVIYLRDAKDNPFRRLGQESRSRVSDIQFSDNDSSFTRHTRMGRRSSSIGEENDAEPIIVNNKNALTGELISGPNGSSLEDAVHRRSRSQQISRIDNNNRYSENYDDGEKVIRRKGTETRNRTKSAFKTFSPLPESMLLDHPRTMRESYGEERSVDRKRSSAFKGKSFRAMPDSVR